jgi:hypothetical protein
VSESWIDPGSLEGDALRQWYLRSPADVEQDRQEAAARRYQDFFDGSVPGKDADPQLGPDGPIPGQGIDPGFAMQAPSRDIDPGFTWVADGPNRLRSVRITTDGQLTGPSSSATSFDNGISRTDGALRGNVSYRPPSRAPAINSSLGLASTESAGPHGKLHPVPGWHTTGPFEFGAWSHNIHWGGVAKDLGEIIAGIPAFFSGVGAGADLLAALGPEAESAVAEGIAESPAVKAAAKTIHGHHVDPKYMGGGPRTGKLLISRETFTRSSTGCSRMRIGRRDSHRVAGKPVAVQNGRNTTRKTLEAARRPMKSCSASLASSMKNTARTSAQGFRKRLAELKWDLLRKIRESY